MKKSYIISSILILALLVGVTGDFLFYRAKPVKQLAFFPLEPGSTWTYLVKSQSQQQDYILTDRADRRTIYREVESKLRSRG